METLPLRTRFDIVTLTPDDAHELSPLIAAYVQDMKHGAPGRPDDFYAQTLLGDRTAEIMGARLDGELVAFAVYHDLPDALSGRRIGQIDDLFVIHHARGRGIARALVDSLTRTGKMRDWLSLRCMVPSGSDERIHFAETLGPRAPIESFTVDIGRRLTV
ncbi:GNAT family N-acetyltransferase [Kaistia dalseonensis]|uniref:GNAT superfamily N-acetyltransferase n=1 Tax=Kaistia dalseonensis TaxID=410840 RepID=A0ABU0H6V1_9HYPH|nr:GNAT family N-acetyltransferase [Kaistia dalseonensis]MCX5494606.1 GNAT family N-acetyltransferase [Kaistia dalseonensis]MDQ0437186.1 GNAT superfamily N-acetyltransferase [Kaistia dalseonensis]